MSTQTCLASCRTGFEFHDYTKKPGSSRHEIKRNAPELSLGVKGKRKKIIRMVQPLILIFVKSLVAASAAAAARGIS